MAEPKVHAGYYYHQQADGSWKKGAPVSQMPADPTFPLQAPKVQAEIGNTVANAQGQQIDNRVAGATVGAQITSANADATSKTRTAQTAGLPEGFMWGADGRTAVPIPGYTRQGLSPEIRSQAIQVYSDSEALERAADEIEELYKTGPGATKGFRGVADYLPTGTNKVFNDAGQQARGYVKRALGFTGGEGNTVAESAALYDPYLPSASDRDEQIVRKIGKLRELAADARKKAVTTLGGMPGPNGTIIPMPEEPKPSAMDRTYLTSGDPLQAAAFGDTKGVDQYPPEMLAKHEALIGRLMMQGGGRMDPQAYAEARSALDAEFGYSPNTQQHATWATGVNDYLSQGGKTVPTGIEPPERDLDVAERMMTNVNTFPGAAAAGFADMGSFGAVSALAPDQMGALTESQPEGMAVGGIGGAIGGTSLLGKFGKETFGRILPSTMRQGGREQFARQLVTDAGYSGVYGGVTGQNPLEATAWGAGGSAVGTGLGKTVGGAVRGATASAPVQALRARGIPLTGGQALGGIFKGIEDKATSIPLVGDIINARRMDGLRAFNREAMSDAGSSIGFTPGNIGKEGVQELFDEVGNAYDSATAGVRVPLDAQFGNDFAQVAAAGQKLPDDLRGKFGLALNNRVGPIADAGELTGDTYQQSVRGLKSYKAENVKPGFEQDYRDALSGAINTLKGQMTRGGGADVVEGLGKADDAYRNIKIIDDAVGRAKGGSVSGEIYTFTPSQLQGAVAKSAGKYPGQTPLSALADTGQQVLPSQVPDSGTAGRLAMGGGGMIGIGAGGGALLGGQDVQSGATTGMGASAALTGALLALGTKRGQRMVTSAMLDRPQAMRTAGNYINTRSGLFGRAMLPFALSPAWTGEGY